MAKCHIFLNFCNHLPSYRSRLHQLAWYFDKQGVVQKLCRPNLALFWPPTPLRRHFLTFFSIFQYIKRHNVDIQGVPKWNGQSNSPLTDGNMQVIFNFKVVLRIWDGEFYKMKSKTLSVKGCQRTDCFFPVHTTPYYSMVDQFLKMF